MSSKDDETTPILTRSGGYPLLQSMAVELIEQLSEVRTFEALNSRRHLRSIVAIMAAWGPDNQPLPAERARHPTK